MRAHELTPDAVLQGDLAWLTQQLIEQLGDRLDPTTIQLLREQSPELSSLDLSKTPQGKSLTSQHIKLLADFLELNKTVTSLNLNYNQEIGSDGVAILVDLLERNTTLRELYLSACLKVKEQWLYNFHAPAVRIVEALVKNTTLKVLDLSLNDLEYLPTDMAIRFYGRLANDKTLIELNLAGNNIGKYHNNLNVVLRNNKTLKTLNLEGNALGNGVVILGGELTINTTLTTLNLANNQISDAHAKYIAAAVKANRGLTVLDLSENTEGLTNTGLLTIAEALKINSTLTIVKLSNPYHLKDQIAEGVNKIRQQLEENIWVRNKRDRILASYCNAYLCLRLAIHDETSHLTQCSIPRELVDIICFQLVLLRQQAPLSEEFTNPGGAHRCRMFEFSWEAQIKDKIYFQYETWVSVSCIEGKGIQISLKDSENNQALCHVLKALTAESTAREGKMIFLIKDGGCIQSLMVDLKFSEEQYGDFCQRYDVKIPAVVNRKEDYQCVVM